MVSPMMTAKLFKRLGFDSIAFVLHFCFTFVQILVLIYHVCATADGGLKGKRKPSLSVNLTYDFYSD